MLDTFGAAMRALRQQQQLSLTGLAARVRYSKGFLSNVEAGRRAPSTTLAAACDTVFGTTPLMVTLLSIERGDDVKRRALLGGLSVAATALITTTDGTAALAAALDHGLRDAVAAPTDWDTLAADFTRRHVLAPTPQLGSELAAQLAIAQHHTAAGDIDATRGAALLALTYGLWLGDTGRIPTAHGMYTTAAHLADRSRDTATRALVRARAASRGIYEGWTRRRTQHAITEALAISGTGLAGLEAHAAAVHLAGLTGDLPAGRTAVAAMRRIADTMHTTDGPTAGQRAVSFHNYLECRTATLTDAHRAHDEATRALADVPLWRADADLYMGRALVAAGDVREGITLALSAVRGLPFGTRVLGLGVRDVLSVVPRTHRAPDLVEQLRLYASPGPTPWETI